MAEHEEFYDDQYQNVQEDVYRQIRAETYGEDIGQTGWNNTDDCRKFFSWLNLDESSRALDVACGSGGTSVFMSQVTGAHVTGVDINPGGIAAAIEQAQHARLKTKTTFQVADASTSLRFPSDSFDAIFCNDSINHLPDRLSVLQEWHRLMRAGAHLVYTDPIIVTGILSNEEIAIRSSIGHYLYTPVGENERLIAQAGFELMRSEDVSERTTDVAKRWHDAREKRREHLVDFEGKAGFEKSQVFLSTTYELSHSGRLSRYAYLARKRA